MSLFKEWAYSRPCKKQEEKGKKNSAIFKGARKKHMVYRNKKLAVHGSLLNIWFSGQTA